MGRHLNHVQHIGPSSECCPRLPQYEGQLLSSGLAHYCRPPFRMPMLKQQRLAISVGRRGSSADTQRNWQWCPRRCLQSRRFHYCYRDDHGSCQSTITALSMDKTPVRAKCALNLAVCSSSTALYAHAGDFGNLLLANLEWRTLHIPEPQNDRYP